MVEGMRHLEIGLLVMMVVAGSGCGLNRYGEFRVETARFVSGDWAGSGGGALFESDFVVVPHQAGPFLDWVEKFNRMPRTGVEAHSLREQSSLFFDDWRSFGVDSLADRWWIKRGIQVACSAHGILTLRMDEEIYAGGAREVHRTVVASWDHVRCEPVMASDVIDIGKAAAGGATMEPFGDWVKVLAASGNIDEAAYFAVTSKGVMFSFGPHELAPGPGPVDCVLFEWQVVEAFLTSYGDSIVRRFANGRR